MRSAIKMIREGLGASRVLPLKREKQPKAAGVCLFLAIVLLLTPIMAGCAARDPGTYTVGGINGKDPDGTGEDQLTVISTLFPHYDFARTIAGDRAKVTMLLPPGVESHSYEPTPADIIAISKCDLFIYTGAGMEVWADSILEGTSNKTMRILALADGVKLKAEHDGHDEHGDDHNDTDGSETDGHFHEYDPHIWTSPANASIMADMILESLCDIDPDNSDYYTENTNRLKAELEELDGEFREITDNAKRKEIFVADRFALRYFADEYGLEYHAAFDSCSSETEPSAAVIADMTDQIREENIPVIFYGELTDPKVARALSRETGAGMLLLHSCHNVSKEDLENGATYVSLMKQNAENLKIGLN